jgi:hypothetical protein
VDIYSEKRQKHIFNLLQEIMSINFIFKYQQRIRI